MSTTPSPFSVVEPWDLVAEGYADEAGAAMAPFSLRAIELVQPSAQAQVIDVAAGPGTLVLEIAPRVAGVTAVDFSAQMNERLRAQATQRGLSNVRVVQADGQALPLPDASFDAGFSMFGWLFFPDRARGLAELHRVLRSGASLVVSSWAAPEKSPLGDSPPHRSWFTAVGYTSRQPVTRSTGLRRRQAALRGVAASSRRTRLTAKLSG